MEFVELFQRGGTIMYVLAGLSVVGVAFMLLKTFDLFWFKLTEKKKVKKVIEEIKSNDSYEIDTYIQSHIKKLEKGVGIIKTIATTSPLIGLIGTVYGILITFDQITKSGLNDPSKFSNGISIALITTVAGLLIAIPHYIYYNQYTDKLDQEEVEFRKKVIKEIKSK